MKIIIIFINKNLEKKNTNLQKTFITLSKRTHLEILILKTHTNTYTH